MAIHERRPASIHLETEHLTLRPLPAEAAAALPRDRAEAARILGAKLEPDWPLDDIAGNLRLQATAPPGDELYGVWAVIERETGLVVGEIGFEGHPAVGTVETFFSVVPSRRRRGYASEAARALVGWAFQQPGVVHVHARCQPQNFASIATLERAGFHLTREDDGLLHWRATNPTHPEPRHWWRAERGSR